MFIPLGSYLTLNAKYVDTNVLICMYMIYLSYIYTYIYVLMRAYPFMFGTYPIVPIAIAH